ncbi:hypothetical protein AWJ20_3655 [Sugiyamaella lignohabitans]|uniref:Uncharacterized protein n=1 Tax=Sugiyamaella lignohabitans TaxID=796027 RepID=A0A170QZ96_9ASCO|nr:uncharacterized protein AWJ20_3655 [Sugiyamaella lignohabitans]ANB16005.1 hypothetical protein AWJ20_3655 [Sugiyamaella lignohabitans]
MNTKHSLVSILDPDTNNSYKYDYKVNSDSDLDDFGNGFQPLNIEHRKALLEYMQMNGPKEQTKPQQHERNNSIEEKPRKQPSKGNEIMSGGSFIISDYTPISQSTPYNDNQISGSTLGDPDQEKGKASLNGEEKEADNAQIERTTDVGKRYAEEREGPPHPKNKEQHEDENRTDKTNGSTFTKRETEYRNAVNMTPISKIGTFRRDGIVRTSGRASVRSFMGSNGKDTLRPSSSPAEFPVETDLRKSFTERPGQSSDLSETVLSEGEVHNAGNAEVADASMLHGFLAFIRSHPHGEELFQQFEGQWKSADDHTHLRTALPVDVTEEVQQSQETPQVEQTPNIEPKRRVVIESVPESETEVQVEPQPNSNQDERYKVDHEHAHAHAQSVDGEARKSMNIPLQISHSDRSSSASNDVHQKLEDLLRRYNSTHEENIRLLNENRQLKDEFSKLQSQCSQLLGRSEPINSHSFIKEKLYNRLELNEVDSMSLIDAQNMIKNIALIFDMPVSRFSKWLPMIAKLLGEDDVYLNFTQEVHRIIYSGQELRKRKNQKCLQEMLLILNRNRSTFS